MISPFSGVLSSVSLLAVVRVLIPMGSWSCQAAAPDEPSIQILLAKVYKTRGDTTRAAAANAKFQRLVQAKQAGEEKHAAEVIRANP